MIWLSEILIQEQQLESFAELKDALRQRVADGEFLFGMDIKPQFSDTPNDWENLLESIFVAHYRE